LVPQKKRKEKKKTTLTWSATPKRKPFQYIRQMNRKKGLRGHDATEYSLSSESERVTWRSLCLQKKETLLGPPPKVLIWSFGPLVAYLVSLWPTCCILRSLWPHLLHAGGDKQIMEPQKTNIFAIEDFITQDPTSVHDKG